MRWWPLVALFALACDDAAGGGGTGPNDARVPTDAPQDTDQAIRDAGGGAVDAAPDAPEADAAVCVDGCEHGECTDGRCVCEPGWSGPACNGCEAGWHPDGMGGCTMDPCVPDRCGEGERCLEGRCDCAPGTHREDGVCLPDEACADDSCNFAGTCSVVAGRVACACDEGHAGDVCEHCAADWHEDGRGGCTQDPCLPDPCDEAGTVCVAGACPCADGFHRDGDGCVPDEACDPARCNGHGVCALVEGRARCDCEPGWAAPLCEGCADGFHPDGAGGCTDDPCTPNPCAVPGTECVARNGMATCPEVCLEDSCDHGLCAVDAGRRGCTCADGWAGDRCDRCDEGWHPDGEGGCTRDPCRPNPCDEPNRGVCAVVEGEPACQCDPGFHDEDVGCVVNQACDEGTCNGHGGCVEADGRVACDCDDAWGGDHCERCADGFHGDGDGGCTQDPCRPNPCAEAHRSVCAAGDEGRAVCGCDDGYHLDGAECVLDENCGPGRCGGHGDCREEAGLALCTCEDGYQGDACAECAEGFHEDGEGGCTDDPCRPSPCEGEHRVCVGAGECACEDGFHEDGAVCVVDEVCDPDRCNGHGECSVDRGVAGCDCGRGYEGDACDGCVEGFHEDGAGGCTDDPCLPDPCDELNRGVCDAGECRCDPGFHEDGVGGCTADPCVPDPCLANNEACRNDGGQAECFVPECDDGNPCTDDVVRGGRCAFDALDDGAPCSTTLCADGQRCLDGACDAGDAVVCDDRNPCTRDVCDDATGCEAEPDDDLVPDDDVPCTTDTCVDGEARNETVDARCDDGAWCNGEETCTPAGCVDGAAPTPPPIEATPCRFHGACDEGADEFPLIELREGDPCDDGLVCTVDSECTADGACVGEVVEDCPADISCDEPGPLGEAIDVAAATLAGHITMAGGELPAQSRHPDSLIFYLVSHDTGAWHQIASVGFGGCCGRYEVVQAHADYATRLVPGVYDLLYRRDWSQSTGIVDPTDAADPYVKGMLYLRRDVVVGPGANRLDIDVPRTGLTGTITMGGAPLPAQSRHPDSLIFYLVRSDTNAWHQIASVGFGGCCGRYEVVAAHADYATAVPPGTYDLLYRRDWSQSTDVVDPTDSADAYVKGLRYLRRGIVVDGADAVLDIDVPATDLTGDITISGGPLPVQSRHPDSLIFYLRAHDTGAWHQISSVGFGGCCGRYDVVGAHAQYATRLMPGTYDLLYRRDWSQSTDIVDPTDDTDAYVKGMRVLAVGVEIAAGADTLDIDVGRARVEGHLTVGGAEMPAQSRHPDSLIYYFVAHDTGAWHQVASVGFGGCCGRYDLVEAHRDYATWLPPGTYDVLFRRDWSQSTGVADPTDAADGFVKGLRFLRRGVEVRAGEVNRFDLDVPLGTLSGSITLDGQPLPAQSRHPDSLIFYLRAHDTGAWHQVASVGFGGCCGRYELVEAHREYATRLMPGTYDLLYRRDWSQSTDIVDPTDAADGLVKGMRVLALGVEVEVGDNQLNIDVPSTDVATTVLVDGHQLPVQSRHPDSLIFYLRSRDDLAAWHQIGSVGFGGCCGRYEAVQAHAQIATRLLPGVYDLLYRRDWSQGTDIVDPTDAADAYVKGMRLLGTCVEVR